ncbi:MAG: glycosyltransferase family 4 protein [Dermatophilaceae bacterium]
MAESVDPSQDRPHVVIVRPTDVETDSRAKKMAISLERLGYDVTVLGRSGTTRRQEGSIGGARVVLLPPRSRLRGAPQRVVRLPHRRAKKIESWLNTRLQRTERRIDATLRGADREGFYLWSAAQRDFRTTYGSEIVRLRPDVVHCHDPRMLPVAFAAAERIEKATGRAPKVVFDSRENFAGVPPENITLARYHDRLLRQERRLAPRLAAVITVSADTATALHDRLPLPERPTVVLNAPVAGAQPAGERRSIRADCGIDEHTPLMVYPGAATPPRGVDTMVDALAHLPQVHAALVVVPFPHPREGELRERADRLGVADRLHILPPVPADHVPGYLAEADVAVSPILRGPANHEAALPNKLFEMLHSLLPIVTSDIRAMSQFVREHDLGPVFTSGDATDLARAVREVLDEPGRFASTEDRRRLARQWSWQTQEGELARVYATVAPPGPGRTDETYPPVVVDWS